MLVFRKGEPRLLETSPPPDLPPLERLIVLGSWACAEADQAAALADELPDRRQRQLLAAVQTAAAEALAVGKTGLPPGGATLPPWQRPLSLPAMEGFRDYALFPQRYAAPARRWSRQHPGMPLWVIGLRSIGAVLAPALAAVVAAAGHRVELATLRPRGDPFARSYCATASFEAALRGWCGHVAVVDEGPGLSGSSLTGAVLWLEGLGIPAERIHLFPGREPPAAELNNATAALQWPRFSRYPAAPLAPPAAGVVDLTGGRWRTFLGWSAAPPVWPQHERAKYLIDGGRALLRFCGLGWHGARNAAVAAALNRAGFAPASAPQGEGWLRMTRVRGQHRRFDPSWARFAGRYLAWRAAEFRGSGAAPPSRPLREMLEVNLAELVGKVPAIEPVAAAVVDVDGRVQPFEWGWSGGRWWKFDAIDHGDDHFFPGPCDIAWDLAGLEIEFKPALARAAGEEYMRRSGDFGVQRRLPWYRHAYAAAQAALCDLAAGQVREPDRSLFLAEKARYVETLRAA